MSDEPGHPEHHLSKEINEAIAASDRDGGIWMRDVEVGQTVLVQTKNTLYELTKHEQHWSALGGKYFARPRIANIHGSTFGGSMIRPGFIGVGMYLEFSHPTDDKSNLTTSVILSAKIKGATE